MSTFTVYPLFDNFYNFDPKTGEISSTPHKSYTVEIQSRASNDANILQNSGKVETQKKKKSKKKQVVKNDLFDEDYREDEYDTYCESLATGNKSKNNQSRGQTTCYSSKHIRTKVGM